MPKYEAHITCPREEGGRVMRLCEEERITSWGFSAFDADPVLGDKPYFYLTMYSGDEKLLKKATNLMAAMLTQKGVSVIRQKIERIIYDTKTEVDEIR
jgi:hypothetical protein